MPSNTQRISAVLATGVIVLAGGWLASQMSPASALESGHDGEVASLEPDQTVTQAQANPVTMAPQSATLSVTISGVRSGAGNVYAILFDNAQGYAAYDINSAADLKIVSAQTGTVTVDFTGLAQGSYVVSVFHDENGNQDFDMAGGYPAEGYGTTRANGPYDEPTFDQASVPAAPAAVQMHYLD